MRSEKQNQASKHNGKQSKGPVTDAGKANSAQNATTHNLSTGHLSLLSNEDARDFHYHEASYLLRFQPADLVEQDLVQKMICASWRERRIAAMESALLEIEMDRQTESIDEEFEVIAPAGRHVLALFGTTDASAAVKLLMRYGAAAHRAYASAFRLLRDLQGDRFNRRPYTAPLPEYVAPLEAGTQPSPGETSELAPVAHASVTASPVIVIRRTVAGVLPPARPLASLETIEFPNEPKLAATALTACAAAMQSAA